MGNKKLILVANEENVARIIYTPSMIFEGELSHTAFLLVTLPSGSPESYLSVWRTKIKTPTRKNVKFPPRKANDILHGFAELNVKNIHTTKHENISSRTMVKGKNNYHAGIYLYSGITPIIGESIDPDLMIYASLLAKQANLKIL